ncbi:two-component system sensor histidine kinase YesM [Paenibacillus qinlingensis]|uniref:Two-component system sensor histidine kinase YesM n=1 Tax=Paenibacillus qinlingensis TaxID=1837343 RepID=A0ABU1P384_9BACL|nr:two-component system sensor histidine kinase YesM [Paenibacillus qinlingensis]
MNIVNSVRFKIFIGFALVVAPLVLFLAFNNVYSMNVVRDQISQNYNKLLQQYVEDTDNTLKEFDNYLFHLYSDPDVINMNLYPLESDDYVLAKQRLFNKLTRQLDIYNLVNTFFVFSATTGDLLVSTRENTYYYDRVQTVKEFIVDNTKTRPNDSSNGNWLIMKASNGDHYLMKINKDLGAGLSGGILIKMSSMVEPLSKWDTGEGGGTTVVSPEGTTLTNTYFPLQRYQNISDQIAPKNSGFQIVKDKELNQQFLIVREASTHADLEFELIIAEKNMLKNLPYLQLLIYFLPLGGAFVLGIYLLYVQRILFKPLMQLIRGMRKIAQGELSTRLHEGSSTEFAFLIATFNNMVDQIENLKISVYEEKIRVQQAEFKHLQVQINPHFYMNSLNIIYNLAALKDTKSVQKMSLHLADYFRFIMRTNRTTMTLKDEIDHIRNYLEIQVMRYPDHLTFDIQLPERYSQYAIPPLIVQPFVENAVIHGFTKQYGTYVIQVKAEQDSEAPEEFFILSISDNGEGFQPEMLQQLNSAQYLDQSGDEHLGIWNVRHRLQMNYGNKVALRFMNKPDRGAMVQIRLPLHTAVVEGMDKDV